MKNNYLKNILIGTVSTAALLALMGCDFLNKIPGSKKADVQVASTITPDGLVGGGTVLAEAFGKPYVSQAAFDQKLAQMLLASPYTRGVDIDTLPAEAKINFLKDWINFLLIKDVWGKQVDIENNAEFQKKCTEHFQAVKDSLIVTEFVQELKKKLVISDQEAQEEFSANKDRYVKAPGGALFVTAAFEDSAAASNFYKQVRKVASTAEFKDKADAAGAETKDLGFVNTSANQFEASTMGLPASVRKVIYNKSCAQVTLVDDKDQSFVVLCFDKKAPKYFDFEEIKSQVKSMLEETHHKEALDKALEQLRTKANVVIKTDAFVQKKTAQSGMNVMSKKDLKQLIEESDEMTDDQDDLHEQILEESIQDMSVNNE